MGKSSTRISIYSEKIWKISVLCSVIILITISTAWSTKHALQGGAYLPKWFIKTIIWIARLPGDAKSITALALPPRGVTSVYDSLSISVLTTNQPNGFLLISYINDNGNSEVILHEISSQSEIKLWPIEITKTQPKYSDRLDKVENLRWTSYATRGRIIHPILLPPAILTFIQEHNDMVSINLETGVELWRVYGAFHHSIELDRNGNIWACSSREGKITMEDNALVKISSSGRILKTISIESLLSKSGLEYLVFGVSNPVLISDPFHLNQVSVFKDTQNQFGDQNLIISLRNLSTILAVDPNQEKVLWHRTGPWMNQHCVTPNDLTSFVLLDNHSFPEGAKPWFDPKWHTRFLSYNIISNSLHDITLMTNKTFEFRIKAQGRIKKINEQNWMVEDSEQGTILIFNGENLVYKWENNYPDGTVGWTSWCRYLDRNEVPKSLLSKFTSN